MMFGQLPLFADFSGDDLALVQGLKVENRHAPAHAILVEEGEPGREFYCFFTGWATRYVLFSDGRRQILNLLLPGDMACFDSLLGKPAQYSVQAITDITYCALDARRLSDILGVSASASRKVMKFMLRERQLLDTKLAVLGRCKAEERIAAMLLSIYARLQRVGLLKDHAFTLPLTQHDLADVLGLNVIHVNRVLRRMREQGLITVRAGEVRVQDMDALRAIAPLPILERRAE